MPDRDASNDGHGRCITPAVLGESCLVCGRGSEFLSGAGRNPPGLRMARSGFGVAGLLKMMSAHTAGPAVAAPRCQHRPLASCVPAPVGRRLPIFREEDEIAPQWNHSLDSEFLSARAPLGSGFLSARSRFGVDGVPGLVSVHSRLALLVLVGLLIRSGGRCSRLMYDNRAGKL